MKKRIEDTAYPTYAASFVIIFHQMSGLYYFVFAFDGSNNNDASKQVLIPDAFVGRTILPECWFAP